MEVNEEEDVEVAKKKKNASCQKGKSLLANLAIFSFPIHRFAIPRSILSFRF